MVMEIPNTENVSYIDEYPELAEKVRIRRLCQDMGERTVGRIVVMPLPIDLGALYD